MAKLETDEKLRLIRETVEDRKGENIEVIDLRGRTIISDYFIIASGTSNVHIRAIVDKVIENLKNHKVRATKVEGYNEATWVLLDYGDVVLHVFTREAREHYDIDSLWRATNEILGTKDSE